MQTSNSLSQQSDVIVSVLSKHLLGPALKTCIISLGCNYSTIGQINIVFKSDSLLVDYYSSAIDRDMDFSAIMGLDFERR